MELLVNNGLNIKHFCKLCYVSRYSSLLKIQDDRIYNNLYNLYNKLECLKRIEDVQLLDIELRKIGFKKFCQSINEDCNITKHKDYNYMYKIIDKNLINSKLYFLQNIVFLTFFLKK